ncbi:MAG: hypothetical protein KME40_33740 [Komarekiella atlantica HA4396-MV6]|jgi:hypothetical protein|nr:hypothetical protein [Komarekiella atlantica HA4396-MV6]
MNQTKPLSNKAWLRLISYLLAEVRGANKSTRKAAIARIRKPWKRLPIRKFKNLPKWQPAFD